MQPPETDQTPSVTDIEYMPKIDEVSETEKISETDNKNETETVSKRATISKKEKTDADKILDATPDEMVSSGQSVANNVEEVSLRLSSYLIACVNCR